MEGNTLFGMALTPGRRCILVCCLMAVVLALYVCFIHGPLQEGAALARNEYRKYRRERHRLPDRATYEKRLEALEREEAAVRNERAALSSWKEGADRKRIQEAVGGLVLEAQAVTGMEEDPRFSEIKSISRGSARAEEGAKQKERYQFKLEGSMEGILHFLAGLPRVPGVPRSWRLAGNPEEGTAPFTLEMEIEP